jgi:hypothetical protein
VEPSTGPEAAPNGILINRKMGGHDAAVPGSKEQWIWIRTELGLVKWDIVVSFVLLGGCILMAGAWLMTLMQLHSEMRGTGGCRAQRSGKDGALAEPLIFETEEEVVAVKMLPRIPAATKEGIQVAPDCFI